MASRVIKPTGGKISTKKADLLEVDSRLKSCSVTINYTEKLVLTTSFDPATLECLRCYSRHNAFVNKGPKGERGPTGIFLPDQDFPPVLDHTHCMPVMHIKDPTVGDLVKIQLPLTRDMRLPSGTVA